MTYRLRALSASDVTELEQVRQFFRNYAAWLGVDFSYQGFADEVANLPGAYGEADGRLFFAEMDGVPCGCVGVRRFSEGVCEMKRLYVRPGFRGLRLGRQLVEQTLLLAQQAGFDSMLLDTLSDMEAARELYQDCGFVEVAPYYHNPLPGAHYLKVEL